MKIKILTFFSIAYKISKGDSMIYEDFGMWSSENGLIDLRVSRILSRRRRNLKGHRLIAPTVFIQKGSENHTDLDDYQFEQISQNLNEYFSQFFFIFFSHNRIDTTSKLSYVISKHWVESINATMDTSDVHRTWGYTDKKTGRITGLSGQLQRKEADIGGMDLKNSFFFCLN